MTDSGEAICADTFIDSSGFSVLLIQKTLKVRFVSFSKNLFNDSAVVLATSREPEIKAQT